MYNIKSIKLYFFSITKLIVLKLKIFYFSTSYYNKKLSNIIPDRMFYVPSTFLISPLVNSDNEIYQIANTSSNQIWNENIKNNLEFKNLHSFLWLTKIDRKESRDSAQTIISGWIDKYYKYEINSWNKETIAKRIIAWVSNSDITLHKSEHAYKKKFFSSLIKQSNFLVKNIKSLPLNSSRIICYAAIILSGLIFKESSLNFKLGIKELEKIISTYFDNSGFPKSRNPEEVFVCIQYLILIREWLKEAHKPIPEFLNNIIIKCGNCYNFLTNSHKKFPLFNGASEIVHEKYDLFLKRFKYDFKNDYNEIGGLYKIKKNKMELFFDVGNPPADKFSNKYQAGCLAFELISKKEKIICNTGYGKYIDSKISLLSCSTAAHSTLSLNDTSSSQFEKSTTIRKVYGNSLINSHKILYKQFTENEESFSLCATHDGYEKLCGYHHKRTIKVLKKENKIYGIDELKKIRNVPVEVFYSIRFHIYPGIKVVKTKGGDTVLINLQSGEGWLLKSIENNLNIEKNIFFGGKKILNNECICISGSFNEPETIINWQIEKVK